MTNFSLVFLYDETTIFTKVQRINGGDFLSLVYFAFVILFIRKVNVLDQDIDDKSVLDQ